MLTSCANAMPVSRLVPSPTVVSAESIFSKPPSKKQKTLLARVAKRQATGDDGAIDYTDIPALTDKQLAGFRRAPKVLVAAQLGRDGNL